MQLLYRMALFDEYTEETKTAFLAEYAEEHPDEEPDSAYFDPIFSRITERLESVDNAISGASDNWKIHRISKVDLSILRIAASEILYEPDIPTGVSVNEAVELAKKYGSDNSPRFVNGILGNIARGCAKTD
jgi:N utilization substance protein B